MAWMGQRSLAVWGGTLRKGALQGKVAHIGEQPKV